MCVSARSVTYEAVNMDPADVGCTVSNSEMVVIAAVVKVGVGGAYVREEEPQVKGEGLPVCCCCCELAMIRGVGEEIERGGEPMDDAPTINCTYYQEYLKSAPCVYGHQI